MACYSDVCAEFEALFAGEWYPSRGVHFNAEYGHIGIPGVFYMLEVRPTTNAKTVYDWLAKYRCETGIEIHVTNGDMGQISNSDARQLPNGSLCFKSMDVERWCYRCCGQQGRSSFCVMVSIQYGYIPFDTSVSLW